MTRGEARGKLRTRYTRASLTRTKLGGRVLCADPDLLYEEHPDAYKPVEPVVASLIEAGLATPVAELIPVVTVKRWPRPGPGQRRRGAGGGAALRGAPRGAIEAVCGERGLVVAAAVSRGDEAAPWSVELVAEGDAPALLAAEIGTPRSSRGAPTAGGRRASAGSRACRCTRWRRRRGPRVDPEDVVVTATTSQGPGGQHVNQTATAVRVRTGRAGSRFG